jgi:hypothetical protein
MQKNMHKYLFLCLKKFAYGSQTKCLCGKIFNLLMYIIIKGDFNFKIIKLKSSILKMIPSNNRNSREFKTN